MYFCLLYVLWSALNIFAYPSFLNCAEKLSFLVQTAIECDAKVNKKDGVDVKYLLKKKHETIVN